VYDEDELSATTKSQSLWPAFKRAVVGAMFVFEGLKLIMFFPGLNFIQITLFTGHYTIVAGTALSFDIGLGVVNLALSFFLGGTGGHLLVPLVM
jgi:hypothetical protein